MSCSRFTTRYFKMRRYSARRLNRWQIVATWVARYLHSLCLSTAAATCARTAAAALSSSGPLGGRTPSCSSRAICASRSRSCALKLATSAFNSAIVTRVSFSDREASAFFSCAIRRCFSASARLSFSSCSSFKILASAASASLARTLAALSSTSVFKRAAFTALSSSVRVACSICSVTMFWSVAGCFISTVLLPMSQSINSWKSIWPSPLLSTAWNMMSMSSSEQ
mmetsp:Transcript_147569/g.374880  ORF Transcript_147569/g.374880 Transcript_147569/m.374880 type:complete len:225 (+) Transcript_147569:163-837(+)